jgi:hypothetical protein
MVPVYVVVGIKKDVFKNWFFNPPFICQIRIKLVSIIVIYISGSIENIFQSIEIDIIIPDMPVEKVIFCCKSYIPSLRTTFQLSIAATYCPVSFHREPRFNT